MEDMGLPSKDQILKAVDNQYRIQIARFWCSINWLQPDCVYQHHVGFYASISQFLSFIWIEDWIMLNSGWWSKSQTATGRGSNRQPDPWISCSKFPQVWGATNMVFHPGDHTCWFPSIVCMLGFNGSDEPYPFFFLWYTSLIIVPFEDVTISDAFRPIIHLWLRLMETWRLIFVSQSTWSKLKYEMQHWRCIYIYMCGYVFYNWTRWIVHCHVLLFKNV